MGLEEHLDMPGTVVQESVLFDLWLPVQGPAPAAKNEAATTGDEQ